LPEPLLSDLKEAAGEYWVFPGADGRKHRSRQAVWKDVKRAAAALRLTQNAAPHSARKVYAVDLLKKYGDIEKVRRALNHGGLEVTLIYALADKQLSAKGRRRRSAPGRKKA
jgi:site-specific recombinase XerD